MFVYRSKHNLLRLSDNGFVKGTIENYPEDYYVCKLDGKQVELNEVIPFKIGPNISYLRIAREGYINFTYKIGGRRKYDNFTAKFLLDTGVLEK